MAFGFSAKNGDDQFLISDNFENLHFLGQATQTTGSLTNGATEFENGDFSTIDALSTVPVVSCTTLPTKPYNGVAGNEFPDAKFSLPEIVDGNTFPRNTKQNQIWAGDYFSVDFGCAVHIDSYNMHTSGSFDATGVYNTEFALFFSDSGHITKASNGIAADPFTAGSNHFTTTNSLQQSSEVTVNEQLPHRYWGVVFRDPGQPSRTLLDFNRYVNIQEFTPTLRLPSGTPALVQSNQLDPRTLFTHTITSSVAPLVFVKPNDTDRWHALIDQSNSGDTWTFQTLVGGENNKTAPELYCFVPPSAVTQSSETHGMLVQKADGTSTFDSRLRPLALVDGGVTETLPVPCNGGVPADLAYAGNAVPLSYNGSIVGRGGTHLTENLFPGNTTITLADTTSLPAAGYAELQGWIYDGPVGGVKVDGILTNNISWTGKTATTLTGVTGVTGTFGVTTFATGNVITTPFGPFVTPSNDQVSDSTSPAFDFKSGDSNTFTTTALTAGVPLSNMMFAAPSLGQAVYSKWSQRLVQQAKVNSGGGVVFHSEDYSNLTWWVMYRAAFRLRDNNFDSGWNAWLSGLLFTRDRQVTEWRGGGQVNTSVGNQPYEDKTINGGPNTFLIADASKYQ